MKLERRDDIDIIVKDGEKGSPCLILFHGYGAGAADLAGISSFDPLFSKWHCLFPDGVLDVPIGPHMMGKAWFPLDMVELERARQSGNYTDFFAKSAPNGLVEVVEQMVSMIEKVSKDIPSSSIHVGGFSQGSMIAALVFFSLMKKNIELASLSLFSSTFVAENYWNEMVPSSYSIPSFQSHGHSDEVLPYSEAKRLAEYLKSKNETHQFIEFQGGHDIPIPILKSWVLFLKGSIGGR